MSIERFGRPASMLIVALALAASTASAQRVKLGARAPEIDLATLAGGRVKLSKLRGQVVLQLDHGPPPRRPLAPNDALGFAIAVPS